MTKLTVIRHRNFNDFKYGSFIVYVTPRDVIIRGILKKTNNYGLYINIKEV